MSIRPPPSPSAITSRSCRPPPHACSRGSARSRASGSASRSSSRCCSGSRAAARPAPRNDPRAPEPAAEPAPPAARALGSSAEEAAGPEGGERARRLQHASSRRQEAEPAGDRGGANVRASPPPRAAGGLFCGWPRASCCSATWPACIPATSRASSRSSRRCSGSAWPGRRHAQPAATRRPADRPAARRLLRRAPAVRRAGDLVDRPAGAARGDRQRSPCAPPARPESRRRWPRRRWR